VYPHQFNKTQTLPLIRTTTRSRHADSDCRKSDLACFKLTQSEQEFAMRSSTALN
jgi:hypothetical protein